MSWGTGRGNKGWKEVRQEMRQGFGQGYGYILSSFTSCSCLAFVQSLRMLDTSLESWKERQRAGSDADQTNRLMLLLNLAKLLNTIIVKESKTRKGCNGGVGTKAREGRGRIGGGGGGGGGGGSSSSSSRDRKGPCSQLRGSWPQASSFACRPTEGSAT